MKISEILNTKTIVINLPVKDKGELIDKLVSIASNSGNIIDREEAVREIFRREELMSTGIGKGIALPHAKSKSIKASAGAFATLSEPVDFDSIDGKPVSLVILLLGMENNVGNHLRLISKISRLLNNDTFRNRLLESSAPDEVSKIFSEIDEDE